MGGAGVGGEGAGLLIRVLYRSALYFAKMEVNCHHLAERLAQQRPALFMESVGARAPCVGELCRTVSRWRVGMPPRWRCPRTSERVSFPVSREISLAIVSHTPPSRFASPGIDAPMMETSPPRG